MSRASTELARCQWWFMNGPIRSCRHHLSYNINPKGSSTSPLLQPLSVLVCSRDRWSAVVSLPTSGRKVRSRIAKGFAVDQAIGVLREHGVLSGLVNAGGDLAGFGPHEHLIAIRDPRDPARLLARTALRDAALASSGLHFGFFGRSQHCSIIDPRAKQPVTAISGASVRAASCTIADALTKVVMLVGTAASDVLDGYGASALFVTTTGEVLATADWQGVHSLAA